MIDMGDDLFGNPFLRRDAYFPQPGLRAELSRIWDQTSPMACVIGCNPSDAGKDKDDPTSKWWNNWFYESGFGGYRAVNLYPFITPSPQECRRIAEWHKRDDWWARDAMMHNLSYLCGIVEQAAKVFVCWGNIAWDQDYIDHVLETLKCDAGGPELWCWGINANGSPKHPLSRGRHRMQALEPAKLWRDLTF